jgi:hypothetical protein
MVNVPKRKNLNFNNFKLNSFNFGKLIYYEQKYLNELRIMNLQNFIFYI